MSPELPVSTLRAEKRPECVLVLHDDVAVTRLIREALGTFTAAEVVTTPDAEYAFELALQREYKLFIFHLGAKVLGGELLYELLTKAYRHCNGGYRRIPAVIYLADAQDSNKYEELHRDARVKGVLVKPLSIERLLDKACATLTRKDPRSAGRADS